MRFAEVGKSATFIPASQFGTFDGICDKILKLSLVEVRRGGMCCFLVLDDPEA